jgi:hypothetical protein
MLQKIFNFSVVLVSVMFCHTVACYPSGFQHYPNKSDLQSHPSFITKMTIPETGLLTHVEDSGHPFATLTIEFPERNFSEYFTINMEEVKNGSMEDLQNYIGQYITFEYTSEFQYTLLDIFYESNSVFGSEVAPEGEGIKSIEGVFYGAENITEGDLPGVVSVFAEDGENLYFPYFVTQEMVAVNEKVVTVFYEIRNQHVITAIQLED